MMLSAVPPWRDGFLVIWELQSQAVRIPLGVCIHASFAARKSAVCHGNFFGTLFHDLISLASFFYVSLWDSKSFENLRCVLRILEFEWFAGVLVL